MTMSTQRMTVMVISGMANTLETMVSIACMLYAMVGKMLTGSGSSFSQLFSAEMGGLRVGKFSGTVKAGL